MTYEEALKLFKASQKDFDEITDEELQMICEKGRDMDAIAIEAIQKQIPKKPYSNNIDAKMLCPTCNKQLRTFLNTEDNFFRPCRVAHFPEYCECCGQAIDWGDEE